MRSHPLSMAFSSSDKWLPVKANLEKPSWLQCGGQIREGAEHKHEDRLGVSYRGTGES